MKDPTPSRPEPPEGYELNDSVDHLPEGSMIRSRFYPTDNWGIATYAGMDIKPEYHLHWWVAVPATRTPAPEAVAGEECFNCKGSGKVGPVDRPDKLEECWRCGGTGFIGTTPTAPTPPADKDAEITALREENKNLRGQYESMKLTTEVATGEHRELSKRLVKDNEARMKAESALLAANQRIEALEGALRSTAHAENCPWQENAAICENCRELQHDQIDRICLTCGMATLIPTESPACTCHKSALAHAAEVGKEKTK